MKALKTHCKQGHEFTSENTCIRTSGARACRTCRNSSSVKFVKNHPEKNRANVKKHRQAMKAWLHALKRDLKCSRCPESFWACLDFHHRNPKIKEFEIREAFDRTLSKKRILAEIAKCDVLCANCHRKEHFKDTNE